MSAKTDTIIKGIMTSIENITDPKTEFYDASATVQRVEDGIAWVHFTGGADETPAKLTMSCKPGDEVLVRVSGGSAFLVGNISAPPTDDSLAKTAKQAADAAVSESIRASNAANIATQSAALATQAAGEAMNQADAAEAEALRAATQADNAHSEALEAAQAADEAGTQAERAEALANAASTQAQTARNDASAARTSANEALASASSANTAATNALTQLSTVEDVVDVLSWVAEHGSYAPTEDATVNPEKNYYRQFLQYTLTTDEEVDTSKSYYVVDSATAVETPVDEDIKEYYERTATGVYVLTRDKSVDAGIGFRLTSDTAIDPDKTYYTVVGTAVANPSYYDLDKYYEFQNSVYIKTSDTELDTRKVYKITEDTEIDPLKTYYGLVFPAIVQSPTDDHLAEYYEYNGTYYYHTTDTTVTPQKTYYTLTMAEITSPQQSSLSTYYEQTNLKTYYTLTATVVESPVVEDIGTYYEKFVNKQYYTIICSLVSDPVYSDLGTYYELKKVYSLITNPEADPAAAGYYEISEVGDAISTYISTHLTLTDDGLYIAMDDNGYKLKLTNDGAYIIDTEGNTVSTYSTVSIIGRVDEKNVTVDNDSVDVKFGERTLASFGNETYIGDPNSTSYLKLTTDGMALTMDSANSNVFAVKAIPSTTPTQRSDTVSAYLSTFNAFSMITLDGTHAAGTTITLNLGFKSEYDNTVYEDAFAFTDGVAASHNAFEYLDPETGKNNYILIEYDGYASIVLRSKYRWAVQILRSWSSGQTIKYSTITYYTRIVEAVYYNLGVRNTPASSSPGLYSVIEGFNTRADQSYSHAEGLSTNVTGAGQAGHAEGYMTTVSGSSGHAEGYNTTASGASSHAEGASTTAEGSDSHAEGSGTTAHGDYSHASGLGTYASGAAQTVIGKYNVGETASAFIVGGGTDSSNKSNIFTVSWSGGVTAKGGATFNGNMLLTKGDEVYYRVRRTDHSMRVGTAPSEVTNIGGLRWSDSNNELVSRIETAHGTADETYLSVKHTRYSSDGQTSVDFGLQMGIDANMAPFVTFSDTASRDAWADGLNVVKKTGDTMTGELTMEMESPPRIAFVRPDVTADGTTEEEDMCLGSVISKDSDGYVCGYSEVFKQTNGRIYRSFVVRQKINGTEYGNGFYLRINADGSKEVVWNGGTTTRDAWVTALNVLPLSGGEITGALTLKSTTHTSNVAVTTSAWSKVLYFTDKADKIIGRVAHYFSSDGREGMYLRSERTISGSTKTNQIGLLIDDTGDVTVSLSNAEAWRNALGASSGVWTAAMIPSLDASKITSGSLPVARGGTGRTNGFTWSRIMAGTSIANGSTKSVGSITDHNEIMIVCRYSTSYLASIVLPMGFFSTTAYEIYLGGCGMGTSQIRRACCTLTSTGTFKAVNVRVDTNDVTGTWWIYAR